MTILDLLAILATVAGSGMALSQVFQAVKIFRRKSALDISKSTYVILTAGAFVWVMYGIAIKNLPIIISNGIGFIVTTTVIIGCILYGKKQN